MARSNVALVSWLLLLVGELGVLSPVTLGLIEGKRGALGSLLGNQGVLVSVALNVIELVRCAQVLKLIGFIPLGLYGR